MNNANRQSIEEILRRCHALYPQWCAANKNLKDIEFNAFINQIDEAIRQYRRHIEPSYLRNQGADHD